MTNQNNYLSGAAGRLWSRLVPWNSESFNNEHFIIGMIVGVVNGVALSWLYKKYSNSKKERKRRILMNLEQQFSLSKSKLEEIVEQFEKELADGLQYQNEASDISYEQNSSKYSTMVNLAEAADISSQNAKCHTLNASKLPAIVSFVDKSPLGTENGIFLSLDLGGTNFRVAKIELQGRDSNSTFHSRMVQRKFLIPDSLKSGSSQHLFEFVADGVIKFMMENSLDKSKHTKNIKLGFTFSFPCQQTSINSGNILAWSKDFDLKDAVGQDPVVLLQREFIKKVVLVN